MTFMYLSSQLSKFEDNLIISQKQKSTCIFGFFLYFIPGFYFLFLNNCAIIDIDSTIFPPLMV